MELRDYQRDAVAAVTRHLAERDDNPVVVLPTASGKSICMAALIREYVGRWPATRILILAHVKELVSQNADKLGRYWREAPIGIHSAGLGRRDTTASVIFGSVQSVHRNAARLGRFDLIFIDEAHRIPLAGEGMYRRLLADLGALNPALRVVGFTATPYRLGAGLVYGPDSLLNAVAYEAGVKDLIAEGYLSPLVSKGGRTRADLSAVHLRQGEYVAEELEAALTRGDLVARAVAELVRLAADRRAWLVFCAGVRHAEAVSAALAGHGIEAPVVHAGTPREVRDALIARYQRQALRALVNVNVLSEGFDAPHVDCVVLLRPTKSAGLYYQQVGRGLRLAPGKADCLVLDFAGNIAEHGPIDTLRARRARAPGQALIEGAPVRMCPECQTLLPAATQSCPCGYEWPAPEPRHADTPSGIPVLSTWEAPERFRVDRVEYLLHHKPGKPPSLRVDYHCGLRRFSEWICFEHGGFARAKAERWWARRRLPGAHPDNPRALPADTAAALAEARAGALRAPVAILVSLSGKYPEITRHELAPQPRAEATDARDPGAGHRDRAGAA